MTDHRPIVIDFETLPIGQRPEYPPAPVGVAIRDPDVPPYYIAWGSQRPGGPRFDPAQLAIAGEILAKIWASNRPLLFHNAKFDLEVAQKWFGLPLPPWRRWHDTQILAFLDDAHAPSLGLKELAADLLGWPPDEKDALGDWVVANKTMLNALDPSAPATRKRSGVWIWAMPPELVAPYAIGDVMRTEALFNALLPLLNDWGLSASYDRERQLMPILLANEQEGMRLDLERIERDIYKYGQAFRQVEDQLRGAIRAPGLNFDADQDVAMALLNCGAVQVANMPRTDPTRQHPAGQWSMSKDALRPEQFNGDFGARVASALGYRNRLKTCLDTFMRPWAAQARNYGGRITTSWNQTRGEYGGTRTGRPSTNNHNFLNIAKSFKDRADDYVHPAFLNVPELPLCRIYVLPDEGEVFLHRDFSGQELRVFAHGEQGQLWQAYQDDPHLDPHGWIKALMEPVAKRELPRGPVKVLNFQSIYGGGIPALQAALRCTMDEARELKAAHNEALPGRLTLVEEMKRTVGRGLPLRTLGGRLIYPERPGLDGRSKDYKLINYWVQGGAADLTKQALIDWDNNPAKRARFMVAVYDEINASAPADEADVQMAILKHEMEKPRISVPMLSDGKRGQSWGELEKCK